MKLTLFLSLLVISNFSFAQKRTADPLRTIADVHTASVAEDMEQLANARIAILDYDLLREDFPVLKNLTNDQVDGWIMSQVGYISKPQVAQTVVNVPIPVTGYQRKAQRPPGYGRAIVFEVVSPEDGQQIGLIDAKGTGGLNPSHASHSNGVATLGECLREYNYENTIRNILTDAQLPNKTVGSYGVIDAGFDIIHEDGSRSRAGIYLRQSHSRPEGRNGMLPDKMVFSIQDVFRKYGIDPANNVQGTSDGNIYDFGHYVSKEGLQGEDPFKRVPFEQWGYDQSIKPSGKDIRWFYSKMDRPWIWAHDTAQAFAEGRANRDDIWRHYQDMVNPVKSKLALGCNVYIKSAP